MKHPESMLEFRVFHLPTTDGTRTRTPVDGREILSLLRLPFRHCSVAVAIQAHSAVYCKEKSCVRLHKKCHLGTSICAEAHHNGAGGCFRSCPTEIPGAVSSDNLLQ